MTRDKLKIIKEREELEKRKRSKSVMMARQSRLKRLVSTYGFDNVALAGGYTKLTLYQYLRVNWPFAIGEESISSAEEILSKL